MSKEAFRNYKNVHNRLAQIDPAVKRMGPIAMAIQYRKIPIDLDRRLRLVHERKLEEENIEDEKRKKEERRAINFGRSQQYVPRTFNDTLNKVALKIQEVSVPKLNVSLRGSLKKEVVEFEKQPLRVQLARLRKDLDLSFAEVGRHTGIRSSGLGRFERGERPPYFQLIEAYCETLGLTGEESKRYLEMVESERAEYRKRYVRQRLEKRGQPTGELSFGQSLKDIREAAGLSLHVLAEEIGASPEALCLIETGVTKNVSEVALGKLIRSKSIKLTEGMLPGWLTHPSNKSEYLRILRFRAGISKEDFSVLAGRTHQSISKTESGKRVPSSGTVKLYEKVLKIKIVFPDFAKEQSA